MKLRQLQITNARSFLDATVLSTEGDLSIVIGPNGGGKTNLLDIAAFAIRKHIYRSFHFRSQATPEQPLRLTADANTNFNSLVIEPHNAGAGRNKNIRVELEVMQQDLDNIQSILESFELIRQHASRNYGGGVNLEIEEWKKIQVTKGLRVAYSIVNDSLSSETPQAEQFLIYLQSFDFVSKIRQDLQSKPLPMPMVYMPVSRVGQGITQGVTLSQFNEYDQLAGVQASSSRTGGGLGTLPIAMIANKYLEFLHEEKGDAMERLKQDVDIIQLTQTLATLGYEWTLQATNKRTNQYDILLTKQGKAFSIGAASEGVNGNETPGWVKLLTKGMLGHEGVWAN